ncbi:MAG TPA: rod shape-determining protein MreC [Candidatus Limnocylindria bacterium]|nr:rod shape-determining protein MreC [Candidatus Limnocylindria bacterium]
MLGSPTRRSRSGLWLAGFTIASLLMLLTSQTDQAMSLQQAGARALEPLRASVSSVGQGLAGLFGAIGEIDRLRTENDDLRNELAGAQQRIAQLAEAAAENVELRQLLGLTKSLDMNLLPVRIIARDPSNLSWEVGIDAGRNQGVKVGMPVVASATGAGALAGSVVSVSSDSAQVRFVVDTRSSVVALDQQSRALGEIQGQLGGQLVFVKVPITEKLAPGDTVISAGLTLANGQASAYPKGLLIGTIQAVQPDVNALTQTAFVHPALDLIRVERLMVVLSVKQS